MKRETGYYWVKVNDEWKISYCNGVYWYFYHSFNPKPDSDLDEINETRIKNPDEK